MALPAKLKNMNVFNEDRSWAGLVTSVTLPKLARKFEGYRGGGMDSEVQLDMGGEPMELETTCGGPMRDAIRQIGEARAGGVFRRFVGTYQNDDTGGVDAVEITMRGRPQEIDRGEQKVGEGGEFKDKWALVYFKLEWNGRVLIEIDVLGMVYMIDGVDRLAEQRAILM